MLKNKELVKKVLGKVYRNQVTPLEEASSLHQEGTVQEQLNLIRYPAARKTPIAWAENSVPTGQPEGILHLKPPHHTYYLNFSSLLSALIYCVLYFISTL